MGNKVPLGGEKGNPSKANKGGGSMNPRNSMDDINNLVDQNVNAEEEYTNDTVFETQLVDVDVNFSDGSLPMTRELAGQAKVAVEKRHTSVKGYTKKRIETIQNNIKQYYNDTSVANDNKSLANVFFPETFNAVEDWSDDLYLMFENIVDDLVIEDVGDTLEQFLTKRLEITEVDDEKHMGFLRSFTRFLFTQKNTAEKSTYYFKKHDIIKSFLKSCLHKSKFKDKIEDFLTQGINTGMFVLKDDWGPTGDYKLCKGDEAEEGGVASKYKFGLEQEDVYRFNPVDPRMMIFPKHGMPWVTEKINTTFHELLEVVFDADGNPVENPKYDIKALKLLSKHLKDIGSSTVRTKEINYEEQGQDSDQPEMENQDLWDIDGDITIHESHMIPLTLSLAGGKKRVYKCMITQVNLSEGDNDEDLMSIGIQQTPYVSGNPYLYDNFVRKDGDIAGIGLPELVLPMQTMLNNLTGHSVDILNLALWGVMIIDPDVFRDETTLKELTPRTIMKLKNMKGRSVNDVIQWLHPKLDTLTAMQDVFNLYQAEFDKTTRKGPTGEKVAPNPSATEFTSMISEMQKSVNKVGLRTNNIFNKMLERMYIYNMLNMKSNIAMKMQAYRINDNNQAQQVLNDINEEKDNPEGKYSITDKRIDIAPEELFVDGLNFKLDAADIYNKKAIEKQQSMQITQLLMDGGFINNADGTPHLMVDETGAQVQISEFQVVKKLLDHFSYDNVIEKVQGKEPQIPQGQQGAGIPSPSGGQEVPDLSAGITEADVGQQATTISPGINI